MDIDEFSDDEDREARLYAMLHFVDSETTDKYFPAGEIISENDDPKDNNVNLDENRTVASASINDGNKNIKNNISFENIKKKVSHAGRYWASTNTDTSPIVEVNSQYQKININAGVKKAPLAQTPDVAAEKKSESIITLNDKWASKRKSSESTSPMPISDSTDYNFKTINNSSRRTDSRRPSLDEGDVEKNSSQTPIVEDLEKHPNKDPTKIQLSNESNTSSETKKKKSSVPDLGKNIKGFPPIQFPNAESDISLAMKKYISSKSQTIESSGSPVVRKKINKTKIQSSPAENHNSNEGKKKKGSVQNVNRENASIQAPNTGNAVSTFAKKKKSPKSQTSSKTEKPLSTLTTDNVESTVQDGVVTPGPKTKSKKPARARKTLAEKFAAEMSFNRLYTKSLKNPFAKAFKVNPQIITLDSSDDDSVVEVELPPSRQTTIYLDSSDEEIAAKDNVANKNNNPGTPTMSSSATQTEPSDSIHNKTGQLTSVSPVPSVVSSVSDDFIQGDCSSLSISSHLSFNFGLHGTDLCEVPIDNTPGKSGKKSKKNCSTYTEEIIQKTTSALTTLTKNSENIQPSAGSSKDTLETSPNEGECFATPKNKIKKRRNSKPKTYDVPDQSYVTPSIDVYESESSDFPESVIDVPIASVPKKKRKSFSENLSKDNVDSTINITDAHSPPEHSEDSLVMANVVEMPCYKDFIVIDEVSGDLYGSSPEANAVSSTVGKKKKSKNSKCRKKTELEKCIKKMHKYYNTNWGTDFDHIKLKQEMPKEREFWQIDASDKGRPRKRPIICGYCNKGGHRSDKCYKKPKVCTMCGGVGHKDLRCPNKICLNCGSGNTSFSSICDNCRNWRNAFCGICREYGHPSVVCPDTWRRYHLTITNEVPLIEDKRSKPSHSLFCSGCTKRGHLINSCRNYIAFSDFKPASPYIFCYAPIYTPDGVRTSSQEPQITTMKNTNDENSLIKTNPVVSALRSPGKRKVIVVPKLWSPKINKQILPADITENNLNLNVQVNPLNPSSVVVQQENMVEDLLQKKDPDSARKVVDIQKKGTDLANKDPNTKKGISDLQKKDVDLQSTCAELQKKDVDSQLTCTELQKEGTNIQRKDSDIQKNNMDLQKKNVVNVVSLQKSLDATPSKDINATASNVKSVANINCDKNSTTSHLLLTNDHAIRLANTKGEEFLKYLSNKYNITVQKCSTEMGTSLILRGNVEKHIDFQSEMQNKMVHVLPSPVHLSRNSIPKMRSVALEKLSNDINLLKSNLGNPSHIYQSIKKLENNLKNIASKEKVGSIQFTKICKKITKNRRILNMILLGQAGLCEGEINCKKLKDFMNYLGTQTFKELKTEIRDEMGGYYDSIFSGVPRDDYPQMIDQYHAAKQGNNSRPITPVIHKPSPCARQATLLTRIRAIVVRLRKATYNTPKHDRNLQDTFTFLNTCEQRAMNETLSNSAFQEMRKAIGVTDNYIFSLRNKHGFM